MLVVAGVYSMKRKKEPISKAKKPLSDKRLMMVSMVFIVVIVLGFMLFRIFMSTPEVEFSFNAAIIDQQGEESPNPDFNETGVVANTLKNAGFSVTYHRSETINVSFYKGLAKYNYGIIILRTHSALREGGTMVDFFTSEEFSEYKYVSEQDDDLLTRGHYPWKPDKFYFAITPKFIENLEGYFPKSIIIAMGCWSLKPTCEEMAEAFIKKGAKAYIGWTDTVGVSHSDDSAVRFLQYWLVNNMTISEALYECNKIPDFEFPWVSTKLSYYPLAIGDYKLSNLTMKVVLNKFQWTSQANLSSKNKKLNRLKIAA